MNLPNWFNPSIHSKKIFLRLTAGTKIERTDSEHRRGEEQTAEALKFYTTDADVCGWLMIILRKSLVVGCGVRKDLKGLNVAEQQIRRIVLSLSSLGWSYYRTVFNNFLVTHVHSK